MTLRRHILTCLAAIALLVCSLSAQAEVITLKSGRQLEGTIVFQNEQVVVFKDAKGKRYQYPMSEVEKIEADGAEKSGEKAGSKSGEKSELELESESESGNVVAYNAPKVSLSLSVQGGGSVLPLISNQAGYQSPMGGTVGGDFSVGTYSLLQRKIFLGGGIGYHAYFVGGSTYGFLPITLRAEVPLLQGKHAPLLGLSAGYGIGFKGVQGGFYGALQAGWKVHYGKKGGFFLGLYADFQQARMNVTETMSGVDYTSSANRNLCGFGVKSAIYF